MMFQINLPPRLEWVLCDLITGVLDAENLAIIIMKYLCSPRKKSVATIIIMTRSKVKIKVTSPWKLEILPFSNAISSAIYNGSSQLTTDS